MKEFSSILKQTDSSAFRARVCLFFFIEKFVSCCINVYICSERLDYSYFFWLRVHVTTCLISFIISTETEANL